MRFTPKTLKTFEPSFALSLKVDFDTTVIRNGKRISRTLADRNTEAGILIVGKGFTEWKRESVYDEERIKRVMEL